MRVICTILCFVAGLSAAAPGAWSNLVINDVYGIPRHPLNHAEKAGSVLFFYWQDCPICNSYAPEITRICASYTNFAFYVVQIDPDLTATAAKKHAAEYDLRAPVLLDPEHRLVKLAKATVTPEAVVLGKNGQALYRGRIDDLYAALGKKRAAATKHDLREALDAITSGKAIKRRETKAIGCLIPASTTP
jgi:hypothetical protein